MLLRHDVERILDFTDLQDGKPDFSAPIDLRVKMTSGVFIPSSAVVDMSLEDLFGTAFDVVSRTRV